MFVCVLYTMGIISHWFHDLDFVRSKDGTDNAYISIATFVRRDTAGVVVWRPLDVSEAQRKARDIRSNNTYE